MSSTMDRPFYPNASKALEGVLKARDRAPRSYPLGNELFTVSIFPVVSHLVNGSWFIVLIFNDPKWFKPGHSVVEELWEVQRSGGIKHHSLIREVEEGDGFKRNTQVTAQQYIDLLREEYSKKNRSF